MDLNLLEKTEVWINGITLKDANLTQMADEAGKVLGLAPGKIMVVDVRSNHITFDVLQKEIGQENIMGKEKEILAVLEKLPGITLSPEASIHSNGILGLICAGVDNPDEVLSRVSQMTENIRQAIAHRAIIYPTGFEIIKGLIEDTNTPYLEQQLKQHQYKVTLGTAIDDTPEDVYYHLSDALSRGFGLILTTGGVGAEDKDHTVEGVIKLDPQAAVPYIVKFKQGSGRHVKDGVRIGVGQVGQSLLVSLPGPHDEVRAAAPVLLKSLNEGLDKYQIADRLADVLANKWKQKLNKHH